MGQFFGLFFFTDRCACIQLLEISTCSTFIKLFLSVFPAVVQGFHLVCFLKPYWSVSFCLTATKHSCMRLDPLFVWAGSTIVALRCSVNSFLEVLVLHFLGGSNLKSHLVHQHSQDTVFGDPSDYMTCPDIHNLTISLLMRKSNQHCR